MAVVVVTGAARGIGLELVRQLLARGDQVHAGARRVSPALQSLADGARDRCHLHALDLAEDATFPAFATAVAAVHQKVDVLINNAGIYSLRSGAWNPETTGFSALAADDLLAVYRVNTVGPLLLAKAMLPLLAGARGARVVNISSRLGSVGEKTSGGDYAYCGSKAALNITTRALAVDLAPQGVIAFAMTPGWVRTDMGGPQASLSPEESVRGMLRVIDGVRPADAGRFVDQAGEDQPW